MSLILSLETSADVCSVAFHDAGKLLGAAEIREPQAHAARLAPLIGQVAAEAGLTLANIKAVAVSAGPGSYTGLRIGTSTAKGLCYALDVPLIAVGTLDLLAFQGSALDTSVAFLCPMIDARRMEVYCQVTDGALAMVAPAAARIIDADSFTELLNAGRVLFFGSGATKCRDVIRHRNAVFVDNIYPVAEALGIVAQRKFEAGDLEDVTAFTPFYLKEFTPKKGGVGK